MRLNPPVEAAAGAYLTLNFDSNVPEAGDYMTVIGQGLTSDGGTSSNILKEVSTPFMPFETCRKEEHWGDGVIDATMICAGGTIFHVVHHLYHFSPHLILQLLPHM